jgi:hypothetical protein
MFGASVVQMVLVWRNRYSASAKALTYRTLDARRRACRNDLIKAGIGRQDGGMALETAADTTPETRGASVAQKEDPTPTTPVGAWTMAASVVAARARRRR